MSPAKLNRKKERLKRWIEANGGRSTVGKMLYQRIKDAREAENLRACKIKFPPHHLKFLSVRRRKYINWWITTLHRKENPLPLKPKKRKGKSLSQRVRRRLKRIVKTKVGLKTSYITGCSASFLKSHLESLFLPGMSWSNYGTLWHIDHIIPLSKFNLSDPFQLLQASHYSNLQPLHAVTNLKKGNKITHSQLHLPIQLHPSTSTAPQKKIKLQKRKNSGILTHP